MKLWEGLAAVVVMFGLCIGTILVAVERRKPSCYVPSDFKHEISEYDLEYVPTTEGYVLWLYKKKKKGGPRTVVLLQPVRCP